MKGNSTQDTYALEAQYINGAFFLAEGFLNDIYIIFPLAIKLGRVVYNLTLIITEAFVARPKRKSLLNSEHN